MLPPIIDPGLDLLFHALLGWFIKPALGPEVILRDEVPREIVRVLVSLAVAQFLCTGVMRILQVAWYRDGLAGADFRQRGVDRLDDACLLYTSPSPRDQRGSRMPSSA